MKVFAICLFLLATTAHAQSTDAKPVITIGGYLETYYQVQFQNANNGITNLRGFDNRSRTFTLSNVALDVKGEKGPIAAQIVLQVGSTPSTYYLAEPALPGTPSVNSTGPELWKYIQTATVTAKLPYELGFSAGLFPSPVGIEVIPIKDNMNWSRSNLFFGLPFYHTGFHIYRPIADEWTLKLHVYNGWNSVVDNNRTPSLGVSASYTHDKTTAQLLYLGGIERPTGAPEGQRLRHLFDALITHPITHVVTLAAQLDGGFEPNDIGTSAWVAFAGYAKVDLTDELYAAVRGDIFWERTDGSAPIFWPVDWVAEGTLTLAYQPFAYVSGRLEYRHDQAAADAYFGGNVQIDPMMLAFIPNRDMQDTVTAGVTAWF